MEAASPCFYAAPYRPVTRARFPDCIEYNNFTDPGQHPVKDQARCQMKAPISPSTTRNIPRQQLGTGIQRWISSSWIPACLSLLVLAVVSGYAQLDFSLGSGLVFAAGIKPGDLPTSTLISLVNPTATPPPTDSRSLSTSPTATELTFSTPAPTLTPTLPAAASVSDIKGRRQSLPLSCESRSAVDWAAHFGYDIDEKAFFGGLPSDDNPDKGFVGSVEGSWGQIPPDPYGVHSQPVAQRLREYGLNAMAVQGMTLEGLQAQIAGGKPVIVWVVGHIARGTPVPYTSSEGESTIVAKFEHTVIVIGYNEDRVTVLDGASVYSRYKGEFLKSWGVLGNQGVIWID
jgi:uncharacterized protein YvpB